MSLGKGTEWQGREVEKKHFIVYNHLYFVNFKPHENVTFTKYTKLKDKNETELKDCPCNLLLKINLG